jgi:transposase
MHSNSVPRRRHSAEFKAEVLAACEQPGASTSAVALAHGLNANLVRKWRMGRGVKLAGIASPVTAPANTAAPPSGRLLAADAQFVPIEMCKPAQVASPSDAPCSEAVIHVELKRGAASVLVRWPGSAAVDCAAWLRELSTALLK